MEALCRICLKGGKIPIFGEDIKSEDVMEFGGIEISNDDNRPQHLCCTCLTLLEGAILFRETAKTSDEVLNNGDFIDDSSVFTEGQGYFQDTSNDTDTESCIEREYIEYNSESETEMNLKCSTGLGNDCNTQKTTDKIENKIHSPNVVTNLEDLSYNSIDEELFINSEYLESASGSECDLDQNVEPQNHESENLQQTHKNDVEIQLQKSNEKIGYNDNELVMLIVSKPKTDTIICTKCNISFKDKQELKNHETEKHPNISVCYQKCDICHKSIFKNDYKVHLKQHREKYKEKHNKKYGKVECEVCGKKINKAYYKYHMKMHGTAEEQAKRLIDCTICKKSFSAHYYSEHMKRVHVKTPKKVKKQKVSKSKCPICDKNVDEDIYKEHLAKHGGSTHQYICDTCGKVFKHPSAFKTHKLTHGSELKYQCQFCPYRGLHLGLLKIHVRTHTGDYNYKCTECPAKFINKSNLTKHSQRHRGHCNFKCDMCNKGFYNKRDVDKHIKTVHLALKNNICNMCGKGFGHRDSMLSHQLKVHKRERITDKRGRMPSYLKQKH